MQIDDKNSKMRDVVLASLRELNDGETHFISLINNFMQKKWYQSTTVWFNVIVTIVSIATSFQGVATFDKYAELLTGVVVIGNVILRVWFTSQPILATPTVPPATISA